MSGGVLDELRKKFTQEITRLEENERWTHTDTTMLRVGLSFIDAFEAAHPGLVDHTEPCVRCGKPFNPFDGLNETYFVTCPECLGRKP